MLNCTPLPVQEVVLCRFVAFLFTSGLSYSSVRSYLSAVRHFQITSGLPDPSLSGFAQLDYVLKGYRRGGVSNPRQKRLPVTPTILRHIQAAWSASGASHNQAMLWAAFCLGFFGFMRAGEFTYPPNTQETPEFLLVEDIAVDSHDAPQHMTVQLKRSKADPFGAGVTIHLGRTGEALCPVTAMLGYLARRPATPGFLFLFEDGSPLTKPRLVHSFREALLAAGLDDKGFSGHSFRIGAATAAAEAGFNDSAIQMLGRWKSSAFLRYIRTPVQSLVQASSRLVQSGCHPH